MDLVVKARRARLSPEARERVERKMSRLTRLEPDLTRIEVEVIAEASPRVDGGQRVEVAARARRKTFRATGTGHDLETAVDQVVERLERQFSTDHGKRRSRMLDGANRVKSGGIRLVSAPKDDEDEEEDQDAPDRG